MALKCFSFSFWKYVHYSKHKQPSTWQLAFSCMECKQPGEKRKTDEYSSGQTHFWLWKQEMMLDKQVAAFNSWWKLYGCIPVYKKQYFTSLAWSCVTLYVDIGTMYMHYFEKHRHFLCSFEWTLSQTALHYNYLQCINWYILPFQKRFLHETLDQQTLQDSSENHTSTCPFSSNP